MQYINVFLIAILFFPVIAFLITIPYILIEYHKYGSINKIRTLIIYSFILYLITIYFLVILPLPHINEVAQLPNIKPQLIPFKFISDFLKETPLKINNINTYLQALKHPSFYTIIFNVFMTIPFGMYLRYYFKCSFKKTIIFSFLLSLFFELTQATGLYFIYPKPYRLFDVDDLIMNTLGGLIGYYLIGVFKFLPNREEIDNKSLLEGMKVSGLRRMTLCLLDTFIYLIILGISTIFIRTNYNKYIIFILYYGIIPYYHNNQTLGGKFLNVRFEIDKLILLKLILRQGIIYFYFFYLPIILLKIIFTVSNGYLTIFITSLFVVLLVNYFINVINLLKKGTTFYDTFSKVKYESTIKGKVT